MVWWQSNENCHFDTGGEQMCDTLREHQQSELTAVILVTFCVYQ